jgi:hypothetical protein
MFCLAALTRQANPARRGEDNGTVDHPAIELNGASAADRLPCINHPSGCRQFRRRRREALVTAATCRG